jgi:hypothetical protein
MCFDIHCAALTNFNTRLLGPSAQKILPTLTDKNLPAEERVDIKKSPRELNLSEWAMVVRGFKRWPSRPEVQHFCFNGTLMFWLTLILQDLSIDNFFVGGIIDKPSQRNA